MRHTVGKDIDQALSECGTHLTRSALNRLRLWLTSDAYADSVDDILSLLARREWESLEQSFCAVLPFGTGGRRGPRGVGPNRINARTMAESARGLVNWAARYHRRTRETAGTVVIAYDTRIASRELAMVCAEVVAAAGMTALVFDGCRPTPELSFAVRHLGADAGIVVSASHNPPSDNGFKAYGPDGGQIPPPRDAEVMRAVKRLSGKPVPRIPFDEARAEGRVQWIGAAVDRAYHTAVLATGLAGERDARIVYTPLHGTGMHSVPPVLSAAGFADVEIVASQSEPDGRFTTVPGNKPNPEEPPALQLAGEQAQQADADIAIGTDPDADRLGCIAVSRKRSPLVSRGGDGRDGRNGRGREGLNIEPVPSWSSLTGNQIAALLCAHTLGTRGKLNRLNADALVLTTTVTSPIIGKIARAHGAGVIEDLLVGFKYIACVLGELADPDRVVFACEESHGYLAGHYTRDKDAACAALLIAEVAAEANARGSDLWECLGGIYATYGYHADQMLSEELSPAGGKARIRRMTGGLRSHIPEAIAGYRVTRVIDRMTATSYDPVSRSVMPLPPTTDPLDGSVLKSLLPARDNLVIFELAGEGVVAGARLAIRPSGTEPKCKFYTSVWTAPDCRLEEVQGETDAQASALQESFVALARSYAAD